MDSPTPATTRDTAKGEMAVSAHMPPSAPAAIRTAANPPSQTHIARDSTPAASRDQPYAASSATAGSAGSE